MLFNYDYLDDFDSSEDCVVAKILPGLIFNQFVPANSLDNYKLAREFLSYYLGDKATDLDFAKAEILIKPKFSWFNTKKKQAKDHTAPDLLLLFPDNCIIAIEAKYTLPILSPAPSHLPHALFRQHEKLAFLKESFNVREKYLFLLITHQRLFSHLRKGASNIGLQILRQCIDACGDEFRVNTWNCVYQTIQDNDADYLPGKKGILDFFEQKENYMTNSLNGRKSNLVKLLLQENDQFPVHHWDKLRDLIIGRIVKQ